MKQPGTDYPGTADPWGRADILGSGGEVGLCSQSSRWVLALGSSCADEFCNQGSIIESEVLNCQLQFGLHFTPAREEERWG